MNMIRRIGSVLLAVIIVVGTSMYYKTSAASTLTDRNDFMWGINGHNKDSSPAYHGAYLENQIKLAAELGSVIYRFNLNPKSPADYEYLDKVVYLAACYGMELMLCFDDHVSNTITIENRFKTVASRYNGKKGYGLIRYFQMFNETDAEVLKIGTNGSVESDINMDEFNAWVSKYKAGSKGLREGNPDCKIIINSNWVRHGWYTLLKKADVDFDIVGVDWYARWSLARGYWSSSAGCMGDPKDSLKWLLNLFPEKQIIVCEVNLADPGYVGNNPDADENDIESLPRLLEDIYTCDNYNKRIIGAIIYELLNEPNLEPEGTVEREARFGLVKANRYGVIGEKKPIYGVVQQLWGGGAVRKNLTPSGFEQYLKEHPINISEDENTLSITRPVANKPEIPTKSGNSSSTANIDSETVEEEKPELATPIPDNPTPDNPESDAWQRHLGGKVSVLADTGIIPENAEINVKEKIAAEDKLAKIRKKYGVNSVFAGYYDITLKDTNGKDIQPNGKLIVSIKLDEKYIGDKALIVARVEADGETTEINAQFRNGYATFETDHFSIYAIIKKAGEIKTDEFPMIFMVIIGTVLLLLIAGAVVLILKFKPKNFFGKKATGGKENV